MIKPDRVINSVVGLLLLGGIVCIIVVAYRMISLRTSVARSGNTECVQQKVIENYNDTLMAGLFDKGSSVQVYEGYYKCNSVKRGDLVFYRFSANIDPVVRIVYGLPGDKFTVKSLGDNKWQVSVNDKVVSYNGQDYWFESKIIPPLKTYQDSNHDILQENEYLVFSIQGPGLTDSSNLGFAKAQELVGRVIPSED